MAATISGSGTSTLINLTTSGNTVLGDASTDTLNVGNGGLVKDASGNVGIGTASPTGGANRVVDVYGSGSSAINFHNATSGTTATDGGLVGQYGSDLVLYNYEAGIIQFGTSNTERARITSDGNLLVGTTTNVANGKFVVKADAAKNIGEWRVSTNGYAMIMYNASDTQVGFISINASTTTYNTGSDYRLKENIAPMTGALAKVAQLKPCTYTWKATGKDGQGFIAHELSEVVPDAVSGEKDAVDAEGNPRYQGVDTSFLVATLTAAIQELKAIVDAQAVEIAALKGTA